MALENVKLNVEFEGKIFYVRVVVVRYVKNLKQLLGRTWLDILSPGCKNKEIKYPHFNDTLRQILYTN